MISSTYIHAKLCFKTNISLLHTHTLSLCLCLSLSLSVSLCVSLSLSLVSQKVLAKTVHSPFRIANAISVKAAEDD